RPSGGVFAAFRAKSAEELVVYRLHRLVGVALFDEHRDLYLRGRDHLDVYLRVVQGLEHQGRDAGGAHHARAYYAHLADVRVHAQVVEAYRLLQLRESLRRRVRVLQRHREADVVRPLLAVGLQDDIHVYLGARHRVEHAEGYAGFVRHADDRYARHVVILRYAAYLHLFHLL